MSAFYKLAILLLLTISFSDPINADDFIKFQVDEKLVSLSDDLGKEIYENYVPDKASLDQLKKICEGMGATGFEDCPGIGISANQILNNAVKNYLRANNLDQDHNKLLAEMEEEQKQRELSSSIDQFLYNINNFNFELDDGVNRFQIEFLIYNNGNVEIDFYEYDDTQSSLIEIYNDDPRNDLLSQIVITFNDDLTSFINDLYICYEIRDVECTSSLEKSLYSYIAKIQNKYVSDFNSSFVAYQEQAKLLNNDFLKFEEEVNRIRDEIGRIQNYFDLIYWQYYTLTDKCGYGNFKLGKVERQIERRLDEAEPIIERLQEERASYKDLSMDLIKREAPYSSNYQFVSQNKKSFSEWLDIRMEIGKGESMRYSLKDKKSSCEISMDAIMEILENEL